MRKIGALISADIAGASWRPVFLVNVPICAAVMAVALRVLPRDRRHAAAEVTCPRCCRSRCCWSWCR